MGNDNPHGKKGKSQRSGPEDKVHPQFRATALNRKNSAAGRSLSQPVALSLSIALQLTLSLSQLSDSLSNILYLISWFLSQHSPITAHNDLVT